MRRYLSARTVGQSLAPWLVLLSAAVGRGQAYAPGYGQAYMPAYDQSYGQPTSGPGYGQTFNPAAVQGQPASYGQAQAASGPSQPQAYSQAPVQAPSQPVWYGLPKPAAPVQGQPMAYGQTPMAAFGQTQVAPYGQSQPPSYGAMYVAQNQPAAGGPQIPAPQPESEPIATPGESMVIPQDPQPQPPQATTQQPAYDANTYGYSTYGGCANWSQSCGVNSAHGYPCYNDGGYGQNGSCLPAPCAGPPPVAWEVYAGALLMFRDNGNAHTFSYDSAIESNQYLDYREIQNDFLPGVEVGFSRFDCCTCTGWEALYWGLYPGDETASIYASDVTGSLDAILNFDQLNYNGGLASLAVNNAQVHRLTTNTEIHNAELNRLWGIAGCGNACSPWSVRTLVGFRYFRLEEGLEFAADTEDTVFNGDPDELYYTIDTENNLYGGQIGALLERRTASRLGFNAGVKAGVFLNDASATSRIGGSAGNAVINNGPFNGQEWYVASSKDDVAFIGEAKAGLSYQIGQQWRILSDYRVIGVSGVAIPTDQIYHDLRGINDVGLLKTSGSLFLHGVFVGAERRF